MLSPSLPGIEASAIVLNILLGAPMNSLQQLAYMYCIVATMPHLLEALISYHVLFCKAISSCVTKVLQ